MTRYLHRLLLLLIPIMLMPPLAASQTVGAWGQWCQAGGQVTVVQGLNSSTLTQQSYPGCTVTVFLTGTSTPATIYSTVTLTPLSNPFTASLTDGSFLFFAALSSQYDVTISANPGPQVAPNVGPSPSFTFRDIAVSGSGSGGGGGSGTVISVATGAGLTGGPITTTGTISIPNAGVTNSMLANPSVTINTSGGLSGGGALSLGGTLNLAGNGASGTVSNCAVSKALGIYSATGTAIGCDTILTDSGTQIQYGANGTSLLPAYSFVSAPDTGVYSLVSPITYAATSATRSAGTSTINSAALPGGNDVFYVGGRAHIVGVTTDTSFNGDYTLTGVTGTTLSYAQALPDSVTGVGGTVAAWGTGIGGYHTPFRHLIASDGTPAPAGTIRLGSNSALNYYCPGGGTFNSSTACNGLSFNTSTGLMTAGDSPGVSFPGPVQFQGTVFDFVIPAGAIAPCAAGATHSCWGLSSDGHFYMCDLGGACVRTGTVLSVFGMTGTVANLSGAVTTSGSSATTMGEIIVPVQSGYCQGTIGTGNATTYVLAPFVNTASSTVCTSTTAIEFPIAAPCTAKNLYVVAASAGAVGGSGVVTLYKNGATTTMTCTLGTGTTCNDIAHFPTFVAGDTYSLRVLTGQATDTTAGVRAAFACQT